MLQADGSKDSRRTVSSSLSHSLASASSCSISSSRFSAFDGGKSQAKPREKLSKRQSGGRSAKNSPKDGPKDSSSSPSPCEVDRESAVSDGEATVHAPGRGVSMSPPGDNSHHISCKASRKTSGGRLSARSAAEATLSRASCQRQSVRAPASTAPIAASAAAASPAAAGNAQASTPPSINSSTAMPRQRIRTCHDTARCSPSTSCWKSGGAGARPW
mmetsp:Transcript_56212/g.111722  ORF Transcript_56212/g.111722 Transcript_56212/m.111722 type:complete len:216 (-) Transcript_56212:892-1539(-)